MFDIDANKELVRGYFRAFAARDEDWWATNISPGFIRHDPGLPFEVRGLAGMRKLADAMLPGIPDIRLDVEDMVAEGDKVLARLRQRGTHGGELMGVPASGKPLDIAVMDLFRIADGKLVEHWALLDNLNLMRQMGAKEI